MLGRQKEPTKVEKEIKKNTSVPIHSFGCFILFFLSINKKKQKKSQSDRRAESTGVMMTMVMEKERERKVWAQGQVVHG